MYYIMCTGSVHCFVSICIILAIITMIIDRLIIIIIPYNNNINQYIDWIS